MARMISVVIVNWNGANHLAECLGSLLNQSVRGDVEVIVVDNASTDSSAELLTRFEGEVRVIQNESNLGFAAGCNRGIRASRGEFVALLNNDTVVESNWLGELRRVMDQDPKVGSAASKVMSYYDRQVIDNVGHVLFADGLTRGRGRGEIDRGQFDRQEEVFCPSGCAALLRRTLLDDVGLLDERFFAYCEDADLGFRARLRGWRCVYVPTAVVYHKYSASSDKFSSFKALHVERNRLWLALKNLPWPLLVVSPVFTLARYFWQGYGALSGRGASGRFVAGSSRQALLAVLARAYLQAVPGLPGVLRERQRIQPRRTVSGWKVLSWLFRYGISARRIAFLESP
jgi:GT2 family glycosyltransferase